MGKCSKCGKKIEYNNFVVVNGVVYHRECAPAEECNINNKIFEIEEKDVNNKVAEPVKRSFDPMLDAEDEETIIANDPEIEIILDEKKKPKKRRKSRKVK